MHSTPFEYQSFSTANEIGPPHDLHMPQGAEAAGNSVSTPSTRSLSSPTNRPPLLAEADLQRFSSRHEYLHYQTSHHEELRLRRELETATAALARQRPLTYVCSIHAGISQFRASDEAAINWRESWLCQTCQLNARMRLSLSLMRDLSPRGPDSRVFLTEQATFGFVAARKMFTHVRGSEFMPDHEKREALSEYLRLIGNDSSLHIEHEDATTLSFADASFDAIGSFDVLEHIPDYRAALREFARVLVPGGVLVLTAPFRLDRDDTLVRAVIGTDGCVEHLMEPEYHGDPVSESGVLCYYHFGWRVLEDFHEAGFATAEVVSAWSPALGVFDDLCVFVATRS